MLGERTDQRGLFEADHMYLEYVGLHCPKLGPFAESTQEKWGKIFQVNIDSFAVMFGAKEYIGFYRERYY